MKNRIHICLILLLLGLVQSYNLDLECFLADTSGCLQVCQTATEDVCAEPSVGSAPPIALPQRNFEFEQFVYEIDCPKGDYSQTVSLSSSGPIKLPVGLRAPPSCLFV